MKYVTTLLLCLLTGILSAGEITHSGIRASRYGITPFPEAKGWHHSVYTMNTYFPGTVPTVIWTIGEFWDPDECHMNFPNDQNYPTEKLSYEDDDLSEDYLSYFDNVGIKVYLQVETGEADMKTVIDMVLERYGSHSSVIGFGIDVEWYKCYTTVWGKMVTDAVAEEWEGWVKAHNSNYSLFLKHPNRTPTHFPDTYRGELIFVNDCEGRDSMNDSSGFVDYENDFLGVMKTFADEFHPNPVIYQIGYPSIQELWQDFDPKPKVMGIDLIEVCGTGQDVGIYWVDFGMTGVLPHDNNWVVQDWPTFIIDNGNNKKIQNMFLIDPDKKITLNMFSLNGRLLRSMYGWGKEIQPIMRENRNTVIIFQIQQGDKSVLAKRIIVK